MAVAEKQDKGATRSLADHSEAAGRQRFVCYGCKHTDEFLADCQGEACRKMLAGVCPRCGEQNA
jgi:hypothetical protein